MQQYIPGIKKATQINERLRQRDKEDLAEEIFSLRVHNNIQADEIRLLKIEIQKLKKKGPPVQ